MRTGKAGRPRKTLKKGVVVRVKNKGSQALKKDAKDQKTCPLHPEISNDISDSDTHANHVEANNSAMRQKCSLFRRKTNTYAKSKDNLQRIFNVYGVIHNYVRTHFTTKEVPAVRLGIIEKVLNMKTPFNIQYV